MEKTRILIPLLISFAFITGCSDKEYRAKSRELDLVMSNASVYEVALSARVDSLKSLLLQARDDSTSAMTVYRIFSEYQFYDPDSAKIYLDILNDTPGIPIPLDALNAWRYALEGENKAFERLFSEMDPESVPEWFRTDYYYQFFTAYSIMYARKDSRFSDFLAICVSDPCLSGDLRDFFSGIISYYNGNTEEAATLFRRSYEATEMPHIKAQDAYYLAYIAKWQNHPNGYGYWLVQSAIHDIQVPVKAYASLQDLAMLEYSRNRLSRASMLVQYVLVDAIKSKYWTRINTAIEYQGVIITGFKKMERSRTIILTFAVLILFVMLIALFLSFFRINNEHRLLVKAKAELENVNNALSVSDAEKEKYIYKYMMLSIKYLGNIESYRHHLRLILKNEGKDAVIAQLRGPSQYDSQYSDFYRIFDETFLKIHPDFVAKVNSLLVPEARFEDEKSLNLPLRVLAAIRLGITESKDIALFLNCSPASVYTYRSRLKASSLGDKEDFEARVRVQ